jgi:opacity protein-like surface antigen
MINRTLLLAAIFVLSVATNGSASADDLLGLYVGGSAGQAHVRSTADISPVGSDYSLKFDQEHSGWKAFAGIRPISLVGIEVAYMDFGHASAPFPFSGISPPIPSSSTPFEFVGNNSRQYAATAFAMGYLPLPVPFLDIYGKAGAARLRTEQQFSYVLITECPLKSIAPNCGSPTTVGQSQWSTNFAYGAGVQVKISSFAARAEYERINAGGGNPDLLSLGVSWSF